MAKTLTVVILMLAILFPANLVLADMYKWVDENGVTHFSDTPPASEQEVKTIITPEYQSPSPDSAVTKPKTYTKPSYIPPKRKAPKKRNISNNVEIYTTSWCGYCKQAIAFLRANSINFKQYDIEKDKKAAAMMYKLGGTGSIPFAVINGQKVFGFSPDKYKQVLGL